VSIDFAPPWKRIPMIEGLEQATGKTFPLMESPEMPAFLEGILKEHQVLYANRLLRARLPINEQAKCCPI